MAKAFTYFTEILGFTDYLIERGYVPDLSKGKDPSVAYVTAESRLIGLAIDEASARRLMQIRRHGCPLTALRQEVLINLINDVHLSQVKMVLKTVALNAYPC